MSLWRVVEVCEQAAREQRYGVKVTSVNPMRVVQALLVVSDDMYCVLFCTAIMGWLSVVREQNILLLVRITPQNLQLKDIRPRHNNTSCSGNSIVYRYYRGSCMAWRILLNCQELALILPFTVPLVALPYQPRGLTSDNAVGRKDGIDVLQFQCNR